MSLPNKATTTTLAVLLTVTSFSCSMPFFSKTVATANSNPAFLPKPAKLSGVLDLQAGCKAGAYEIKLKGLFEGAGSQVESQSDQSGHFNLVAPPGQYLVQINRDGCGAKQTIELEENTEHMISVVVAETKAVEKIGVNEGRLPASVLIQPHR